jgi:hypothetical protein
MSDRKGVNHMKNNAGSGAIYGIGVLGALVYFIQHASSLLDGLIGIFMALFWPGVVLYKVLELLKL